MSLFLVLALLCIEFFHNSYVLFSKNFHMDDGFSSERCFTDLINFCKLFVWAFRLSVLSRSTSNCKLKSLSL